MSDPRNERDMSPAIHVLPWCGAMTEMVDPFSFAASMMFPSLMFNFFNNIVAASPMFGFVRLATKNAMTLFIDAQRAQAGLHRKEIRLADGLIYVYLEGGKGEPLFLLHCFGADKDVFVSVARHLTTRYRLIIPDQVGFDESSQPAAAPWVVISPLPMRLFFPKR